MSLGVRKTLYHEALPRTFRSDPRYVRVLAAADSEAVARLLAYAHAIWSSCLCTPPAMAFENVRSPHSSLHPLEMTVFSKVLATILSNPREGGSLSDPASRMSLRNKGPSHRDQDRRVVSRATLIVLPVSLVGQWAEVRVGSRGWGSTI